MSKPKRAAAHDAVFLDFTVSRLFSADPYLAVLRRKLTDQGILRVGQLVQLTADEVLHKAPRTSPQAMQRVNERLANFNLKLGMTTNGWRNPDRPTGDNDGDPSGCKKKVRRAAHRRSTRGQVLRRSIPRTAQP
jgi:hypothetical protein